ncbi:type I secretion protein ATPase [Maritimibacter fusiformis]|nr:type I secretion protein ATPase [Maritimibacter fusiformis]
MDRVTEIIAHMIGIFHITLEEERMRDVYDKFKTLKAKEQDLKSPDGVDIKFEAKYTLGDYYPELRYSDTPPNPPVVNDVPNFFDVFFPWFSPIHIIVQNIHPPFFPLWGHGQSLMVLEPPSSVVVITHQSSFLSDNDVLRTGEGDMAFTDPAIYLAELQTYEMIAAAIASPLDVDMIMPGETAGADAIALHDHIGTVEPVALTGVSATVLHGADAAGMHVNGEVADEMPDLDDVLPAYMRDDDEDTDSAAPAEGEGEGEGEGAEEADDHEWPDPFEGLDDIGGGGGPFEIDDGHAVVAGANLLVNQASIISAWLDAPVISVMGDVVNLDVISQVNVLVDHDVGSIGQVTGSVALNAASFSFTSTSPEPDDTEGEEKHGGRADTGLPANWAVTRISGDLINVNKVVQYTFQTDNDFAEISFGSTNTYIGLGDNSVVNLTNLLEIGFGFDLIMVGGNMISVNWINQINVLIDNDNVTYTGIAPTSISGDDNLLFNAAMISGVGVDGYAAMQDNFAKAADDLAEGGENIDRSVAHDSVFEGVDILRVLYIDGDFTTINWIEQTNILGDSDQVHLALDDFQAATGGVVNVTAGSNAVVNMASINEYGVDSKVMVGGEVYDDALLYQAELIDTDADPLGVNMPSLASEAVVFLADDMMTTDTGPLEGPIAPTAPESTTSPDMMQTMLA